MIITETLHITTKKEWRIWLEKNHLTSKEIWLIYNRKHTGKPRISYNDAVEMALCFGWIDSIIKVMDNDRTVQRFSPRRKKSILSEMNKERVKRLIESGEMTQYGLDILKHHLDTDDKNGNPAFKEFKIPQDILTELKADPVVWQNFQNFPEHYKTIRTGWINDARVRPEEFRKRLRYFIKMTRKNKMYGMIQQYLRNDPV
jgi:uncharacterized protein YdeI (YjbR/CyaY-like superfamily)